MIVFFFQAEDGIRDLVRSRGLGDVYKRQLIIPMDTVYQNLGMWKAYGLVYRLLDNNIPINWVCLLYTSDAADERSSVDLGGRRIIKKKT